MTSASGSDKSDPPSPPGSASSSDSAHTAIDTDKIDEDGPSEIILPHNESANRSVAVPLETSCIGSIANTTSGCPYAGYGQGLMNHSGTEKYCACPQESDYDFSGLFENREPPPANETGGDKSLSNENISLKTCGPFTHSYTGDANRTERSVPEPSGNTKQYIRQLAQPTETYPGFSTITREDPEGINIGPCFPKEKAQWWVNNHQFSPENPLSINSVELDDNIFTHRYLTPIFYLLLFLFYLSAESFMNTTLSRVLLYLLSVSHFFILYAFDQDYFILYYQDGLQKLILFLGNHIESLFTGIYNTYMYFLGELYPPEYLYSVYRKLLVRLSQEFPRLLYIPGIILLIFRRILRLIMQAVFLGGFYYPTLKPSVTRKNLHHLNLRGLPQRKTRSLIPKNQNGIPTFFENGLPTVSANINGNFVKFLVDTGSCHNILNKEIVDLLKASCAEFETFRHDIRLSGHSGQLLNIDPHAVKVPVQFCNPSNLLTKKHG